MTKCPTKDRQIVLIAHNLRSSHNVGSLFRTAEGLGIDELYLTGYTPFPKAIDDQRMQHIIDKLDKQIQKTALGSQRYLKWQYLENIALVIAKLKNQDYKICALEQTSASVNILEYKPRAKMALIMGNEVDGLDNKILQICDVILELPMLGKKESFNVVQAVAMASFYLRFYQ